jgi:hypothetical protein
MVLPNLITKKEFSKLSGVNPSSVTHVFPRDHPACDGTKINVDHPEAKTYIAQKVFRDERKKLRNQSISQEGSSDFAAPDIPLATSPIAVPDALAKLTLEEIVRDYGGLTGFKIYISTAKELDDYRNKRLKFEERRGDLVDKKYEAKLLFETIELLFDRLVNDIPIEITQRVIAIIKRGGDDADLLAQREYTSANSRALKICQGELLERLKLDEEEIKRIKRIKSEF